MQSLFKIFQFTIIVNTSNLNEHPIEHSTFPVHKSHNNVMLDILIKILEKEEDNLSLENSLVYEDLQIILGNTKTGKTQDDNKIKLGKRKHDDTSCSVSNCSEDIRLPTCTHPTPNSAVFFCNNDHSYSICSSNPSTTINESLVIERFNTKDKAEEKSFETLLLDALKNISYYRFHISKLFNALNLKINDKPKTNNRSHSLLQQKVFTEFKTLLTALVDEEDESKAEFVIHTSGCEAFLKGKQDTTMQHPTFQKEFTKFTTYKVHNNCTNSFTKEKLYNINFFRVVRFLEKSIISKVNYKRYNDMIFYVMPTLCKISKFFDKNLAGAFESHLSYPPFPSTVFYSDYSKIEKNLVFLWAIDWLYFFSNFFSFVNENFDKNFYLEIKKYPQSFFEQLFLLIHLAFKYEKKKVERNELNYNTVKQIKADISKLLFQPNEQNEKTFYEETFTGFTY